MVVWIERIFFVIGKHKEKYPNKFTSIVESRFCALPSIWNWYCHLMCIIISREAIAAFIGDIVVNTIQSMRIELGRCVFYKSKNLILSVSLVTPKQEVERKSEWFSVVISFPSSFEVEWENDVWKKFAFSLVDFFSHGQFHFDFYCFFRFVDSDFFLMVFPIHSWFILVLDFLFEPNFLLSLVV